MKKSIFRIISGLMIIICAFSTINIANADYTNKEMSDELINIASEEISAILSGDLGTCYLGNKISAYKSCLSGLQEMDYDIYPVLSEGNVVAFVQTTKNEENKLIVSCAELFADNYQKFLDKTDSEETALIFSKDGVYVSTPQKEVTCIYKTINEGLSLLSDINVQEEKLRFSKIEEKEELIIPDNHSKSLQYQTLSVPYVYNSSVGCSTCDPIGLCWAASMAMIVNYYYGSSYNTSSIHTATGCMCSATASQYKAKLHNWVYTDGPYYTFNYNTIAGLIQGGKLSFMRLAPTGSNTIGHIVVPYGYYWNNPSSTTKYFYFMDLNYGGGIQSFPSSGSLYVTTSGTTYLFNYYIPCTW